MPNRLKIFVDAHAVDQEFQGSRSFIHGLYTALLQKADCPDIYFGAHHLENLKKEFPGVPDDHLIRYKSSSAAVRLAVEIPQIIRRHHFDYAHFQYVAPPVKGCRFIMTTHDVLFNDYPQFFPRSYRFIRNIFFKRSLKLADIKTTPSRYSQDRIAFHYKTNPAVINIIPNGVNPDFFNSSISKPDAAALIRKKYRIENFILYTSRIEPRKNHLLLLKTFLDLKLYEQGIPLVFTGKETLNAPQLDAALRSAPAAARGSIHLLSQVDPEDLRLLYLACRLFVYPSFAEGFGIPPLEAAALGVPVLCSNTTAMADYAFFGDHLFNPEDSREFREKLQAALQQQASYERLRSVAEIVRKNYDWNKSAEQFLTLLR